MKHLRRAAVASVGLGLVITGTVISPAHADSGGGDGTRVTRTGTCAGAARWKIKADGDDGRIEVEAEIDSNRSGQRWTWTLLHDGSRSAHGRARTAGSSGSFSVERTVVDAAGSRRRSRSERRTASGCASPSSATQREPDPRH